MSASAEHWPETPQPAPGGALFGSDAVASMLRALGIPFVALNPGASFRGLHDSLVNHLGNRDPSLLLCVHEESAVAIAHGYAKASGRPLAVVLHANVGLLHGAMGVFNAWCDRVPMLVLGATGPVDAARRRPWIDWIHTAIDQGALLRGFTKWDDQPASVPAACESLLRAMQLACTPPCGPVYVNLDAMLQEAPIDALPCPPDVGRYAPPALLVPAAADIARLADRLRDAMRPVLLAGRGAATDRAWQARVALAERLGARVITDLKMPAVFPTAHPLHAGPPGHFLAPATAGVLREADVVLALDWTDLAGTLAQAFGADVRAWVANVSPDAWLHRGFSMDYQGLPPADLYLMADPDLTVQALNAELGAADVPKQPSAASTAEDRAAHAAHDDATQTSVRTLAAAFERAACGRAICLTRLPLGWHGGDVRFAGPLDYLGLEGGGGVGAGPGITVGAALALRGRDRLAVGIMGDGDFLMGVTAVWTAVHYRIPCAMVVANNGSFYNDEVHQERVARARGRPVGNKWIGQRMSDPAIDLAAMARAQGAAAFGPVTEPQALEGVLREALAAAAQGAVAVVDVRVVPGYAGSPSGAAAERSR